MISAIFYSTSAPLPLTTLLESLRHTLYNVIRSGTFIWRRCLWKLHFENACISICLRHGRCCAFDTDRLGADGCCVDNLDRAILVERVLRGYAPGPCGRSKGRTGYLIPGSEIGREIKMGEGLRVEALSILG